MRQLRIFTDGACHPNPNGFGGWGALVIEGDKEHSFFGGEGETTNNRMEMMAAVQVLESLGDKAQVTIFTDSQYLKKGITEWVAGWKRRGWITREKTPVKNQDLWQRLDELNKHHNVTWRWVRGHNGHRENEIADELAGKGRLEFMTSGATNNFKQKLGEKA